MGAALLDTAPNSRYFIMDRVFCRVLSPIDKLVGTAQPNQADKLGLCVFISKSILAAAFAAMLCLAGESSSANANTVQTITGTFNDGGTLTGTLTFNQYGYLTAPWSLTTTAGSSIVTDVTYGPGDVTGTVGYYAPPTYSTLVTIPGSFEVWDVTYGDRTLSLIFSSPDMGQPDSLVGGFECIASYAWSEPTGYDRYLTSDSNDDAATFDLDHDAAWLGGPWLCCLSSE